MNKLHPKHDAAHRFIMNEALPYLTYHGISFTIDNSPSKSHERYCSFVPVADYKTIVFDVKNQAEAEIVFEMERECMGRFIFMNTWYDCDDETGDVVGPILWHIDEDFRDELV